MSRYIDADALAELLKDERDFYKKMCDYMQQPCKQDERAIIGAYYTAYSKSFHMAKDAPTVDAVPVKFIYESADLLRKCADEHGARVLYMLIENWNRADGERKDGERRTE